MASRTKTPTYFHGTSLVAARTIQRTGLTGPAWAATNRGIAERYATEKVAGELKTRG
jgi:hypothetical protein